MRAMTDSEIDDFLRDTPEHAHCATSNADGQPHVVPIWFDVQHDGRIRFSSQAATQKVRILRRDPRLALSINQNLPSLRFVTIRAVLDEIDETPAYAELLDHNTRCAARFIDPERGAALGKLYADLPGHWFLWLRPVHRIGFTDIDR